MSAKILVVDDEPDLETLITQKFRRQIRKGELAFVFARDGEAALARLDEHTDVDVVLTDINMPGMDGLTLLRRLTDFNDRLRAVIVSAYGDLGNIRKAMNLGAFDFLTKPIDFEDLEVTVRKSLDDLEKLREAYRQRAAAEQARLSLARYFSPSVAQRLAEDPAALELGSGWHTLTFVFTDLTDFTALVEGSEYASIVSLLNEYLAEMTRIVFRHSGTVDKVVGDSVHAMFGAPVELADHAERGVACATEMDAFAEAFRARKAADGVDLGATRIGVHTGAAIVGNFGGEEFFDYTAHGDAINTAARLESANKHLGTRICASEKTVETLDAFHGRPVGTLLLKGKTRELRVFEPLSADRAGSEQTAAYREAFAKLEAGDPAASQAFAAVVGQYGDDPHATFHLKRLLSGESGVRIVLGGS